MSNYFIFYKSHLMCSRFVVKVTLNLRTAVTFSVVEQAVAHVEGFPVRTVQLAKLSKRWVMLKTPTNKLEKKTERLRSFSRVCQLRTKKLNRQIV